MNRTLRSILAVIFILIIAFCAATLIINGTKRTKIDVTEQKIYTLSDGTKNILSKLTQPVTIKLFYAKTAAMKGPDQIKFFNNYYEFVKTLLEEYKAFGNGNVKLEVIDPRPFSDEESEALELGLKKFPITEEENFFFGLAVQTQFGVEKTIPFFSPERQNFIEYDISYLIENAITREKSKIGVLSSLEVMGDDVTGYMAQMMQMQGQTPKPSWAIVEQLKQQFEVSKIETEVEKIEDIDLLIVVHPKELPEKTLFAIDQFVVSGGRAIFCVDPYCYADQPDRQQMMMGGQMPSQASSLNSLFKKWGLEMPEDKFAGDKLLAQKVPLGQNQRPAPLIGFLGLTPPDCFNNDTAMTANLNDVKMLFAGVLKDISQEEDGLSLTPLISTTDRGNSWSVSSPYELMMPDSSKLMSKFVEGSEAVKMGYMVSGKFQSNYPDGVDFTVEVEAEDNAAEGEDAEPKTETKHLDPVTETSDDCAIIVFSDVDFITDMLAFRDSFFGKSVVGDNSTLLLNAIEQLSGSSDLLTIRSRGNYKRPFDVVDQIEVEAQAETAEEEAKINAEIAGFQQELQDILSQAKDGQESIVGNSIIEKKKELELKIRQAEKRLQQVKLQRRERIEDLGNKLRNINMLLAPGVILLIAIALGLYRSMRKRSYRSSTRD
ncbi:MAG: Gldg family protein [Sedimentisphaeraceae bacterium JB056]